LAEVRLSTAAVRDLDRMILTHSLPPDTRERVRRSLGVLEQFPLIGRQLEGRWRPLRFILGPWRWMLIIYSYEEPDDVVLVVAFQDGRSSAAATALSLIAHLAPLLSGELEWPRCRRQRNHAAP
jgi:hypothetical protein